MNKIKKIIVLILTTFSLTALNAIGVFANSYKIGWIYNSYYAAYCGKNIETWNYYDSNGIAKEGWFQVEGKWYYADQIHEDDFYGIYIDEWAPEFAYVTKEYSQWLNNYVYSDVFGKFDFYCGSDGAMKKGWFKAYKNGDWEHTEGLHWYYAGQDGRILKNTSTPDGYWVNSEGIYK